MPETNCYRTGRRRRIPLIRSFLFIAGVSILWYFCAKLDFSTPGGHSGGASLASISQAPAGECGSLLSYVVRPGDTFQGILGGFGVSCGDAISWYRKLLSLGLSSLFPGDSLVVSVGRDEQVKAFSLLSRFDCWYHVHRDSVALTVEKQPLATTRYRCVVKGTLNTSLSQDLFSLGVGDALVAKIADIFAWDINFFVDPRQGDRFEVIFEKFYREGRFVGYGNILAAKYVNRGKEMWALAFEDSEARQSYYSTDGKSVQKQFLKAPLRYRRISSGFTNNRKHPILGIIRPHLGIDYAAPRGTPVYAAADGTIRFSGLKGGYGNFVRIAHGGAYETCYGHLHTIRRGIRPGARVAQGDLIGTVGSTGLSTGPHLDYRMTKNGRFVNPLTLNLPAKRGIEQADMPRFEAVRHEYLTILEKRFEREGYYVLDIGDLPPSDTAVTHISIMAQPDNANTPGS